MLDYPPYRELPTNVPPITRAPERIDSGTLHVDLRRFSVSANHVPISLTRLEFDLLVYLMRNEGRVVNVGELTREVVQTVYRKDSSLIRVHITHLRKKLGAAARSIVTVRGRGLLFRNAI